MESCNSRQLQKIPVPRALSCCNCEEDQNRSQMTLLRYSQLLAEKCQNFQPTYVHVAARVFEGGDLAPA